METRITATELARALSDVLDRVRDRGERFVVERNGEPVATLSPAASTSVVTLRDLSASLRELPMPGEGYADDLESVQASQPRETAPAWPA